MITWVFESRDTAKCGRGSSFVAEGRQRAARRSVLSKGSLLPMSGFEVGHDPFRPAVWERGEDARCTREELERFAVRVADAFRFRKPPTLSLN
ncbi:hypothetical protein GCM10011322_13680 [Salinarimonas ramus]|uniref:Uncharacterized protein n=1 Tax=Salinarimonas ramus TaxID=690164 RepID=A0A917V319_9HYPH|nr:hypothetical protein GCM10011322_13680 [Salinarimonas ramus]